MIGDSKLADRFFPNRVTIQAGLLEYAVVLIAPLRSFTFLTSSKTDLGIQLRHEFGWIIFAVGVLGLLCVVVTLAGLLVARRTTIILGLGFGVMCATSTSIAYAVVLPIDALERSLTFAAYALVISARIVHLMKGGVYAR